MVERGYQYVLVTGCSMGIGFAMALNLARAGYRGWATMRNRRGVTDEIRTLHLDSDESVRACFAGIYAPIDVLVNNAGIELLGSVEEMPLESVIAVMNTNYFGTVWCIQAMLPRMRKRRSGCITNISSVAGRIANAPLGAYAASKHAVEAISEALAGEVKPFGIRVAIVEPVIQNTRMAQKITRAEGTIYPHAARMAGLFRAALAYPTPPEVTAGVVRHVVESGTWQLRHCSGPAVCAVAGGEER